MDTSICEKIFAVQNEIEAIKKDATNPFYNSSYFDINSLLAELKPLLKKHGLTVLQPLTNINGRPALGLTVADSEHTLSTDPITLPDLDDPQKMGSVITYYRRYALQSFFLLEAADDDGNGAIPAPVQKNNKVPGQEKNAVKNNNGEFRTGEKNGRKWYAKVVGKDYQWLTEDEYKRLTGIRLEDAESLPLDVIPF